MPVVQLTLSSKTLPEQQIFDYGLNFIRVRLFTIPGLSTPAPFGGKQRQIIVDVDPARLQRQGPVADGRGQRAAGLQRHRAGGHRAHRRARIQRAAQLQPAARSSSSTHCRSGSSTARPVTLGDVAQGQRQLRHADQHRARQRPARDLPGHPEALPTPRPWRWSMRRATLLPEIQAAAPEGLELKLDFDQSVFVRAAVAERGPRGDHLVDPGLADDPGVPRQLAQHGDRRRTSIPLSIFAGIVGLFLTGQTINLMTLGGLALAIGMLVDDATVEIENIHRNQTLGKPLTVAILDGSQRGDPAADRGDAGDLHRVLPGGAADRPGALPVHAARDHGRAGDAGVLRAVVHAGAGAWRAILLATEHDSTHGPPARLRSAGVRSRLRAVPGRLRPAAGACAAAARRSCWLRRRCCSW